MKIQIFLAIKKPMIKMIVVINATQDGEGVCDLIELSALNN